MGSGSSISVPDHVDLETFRRLAGDQFDSELFETVMDPTTQMVPKNKLIWYSKLCDIFITVAARKDVESGLKLIESAERLSSALQERGLITKIDLGNAHDYNEDNLLDQLNHSQGVLCLITETFIERVNRTGEVKQNKTRAEFLHVLNTKGLGKMFFVGMEKPYLNPTQWKGAIGTIIPGAVVGNKQGASSTNKSVGPPVSIPHVKIHDFISEDNYDDNVDVLVQELLQRITPYRFSGYPSEEEFKQKEKEEAAVKDKLLAQKKEDNQVQTQNRKRASSRTERALSHAALSAGVMAIKSAFEVSLPDNMTTSTDSQSTASSVDVPSAFSDSSQQQVITQKQQLLLHVSDTATTHDQLKTAAYIDRLIKWMTSHTTSIPGSKVEEYAKDLVALGVTSVNKLAVELGKKADMLNSIGVADEHAVVISEAAMEMLKTMKEAAATHRDLFGNLRGTSTGGSFSVVVTGETTTVASTGSSTGTTGTKKNGGLTYQPQNDLNLSEEGEVLLACSYNKNGDGSNGSDTNINAKTAITAKSIPIPTMEDHLQELWKAPDQDLRGRWLYGRDNGDDDDYDDDNGASSRCQPGVWAKPLSVL